MNLPDSDNALLIRTDFSNQTAWDKLLKIAREPKDFFEFGMEIVDDRANIGLTVEKLMTALSEEYPYTYIVVADSAAISQPHFPLLVVDLHEERGRQFRATAEAISEVDNNLSISNMDFAEFADQVGDNGVYRGVSGM